MDRPAEAELIGRAREGDEAAFGALVEAHLPRVWRVVWRTLRHREDTEDVVQEVFLAAHRALPGYRGEARFSTWLHRIAVTRALNHLDRAAERIRRVSEPVEDFAGLDGAGAAAGRSGVSADRPASPLESLEAADLARRLSECLARLPQAWREIIALHCESLSYEEIAEALGIATGTVRSRLSRARAALRECVGGGTA